MTENKSVYINDEHRGIFGRTQSLPGWQLPGDSELLFETAYHHGSTILEIGTYGGRSAVVELLGRLSNKELPTRPYYFGVDINIHSIWRTHQTLLQNNLENLSLLFYGNLEEFFTSFWIKPTMVFVDGDHSYQGCLKDLLALRHHVFADVPVICHDYSNADNDRGKIGVRRAVDEFVAMGYARIIRSQGCSVLLQTTDQCSGAPPEQYQEDHFQMMKIQALSKMAQRTLQQWNSGARPPEH
jgi:hypothetical protein